MKQEWILETQSSEVEYRSGFEALRRLIAGKARPDGVVAYTDWLAAGARDAAMTAGLEAPRQIQVVGCGNQTDICEMGVGLTSVDLEHEEIGRRAARLALKRIENKESVTARGMTLLPKLVQRESTQKMDG